MLQLKKILESLSLKKKVEFLGGFEGFSIRGVERFKIPAIKMADGPMGVVNNGRSTPFPATIGLAATFDIELAKRQGNAIGKECRDKGIGILLAPGVNLYKYHQNGRNFEYMGEDPHLASEISSQFIKGVQSNGVIATIKHFIANNSDYHRHFISSNIESDTLENIYFKPFKAAVDCGVKAVMTAYNPVNNIHASESSYLMKDILRDRWHFDGIIISDWVSVYSPEAIVAGLDLEMPSAVHITYDNIVELIALGKICEKDIDDRVSNIIRSCYEIGLYDERAKVEVDYQQHRDLAYQISVDSMVLLKNRDNSLPINCNRNPKIAVLGRNSFNTPAAGGGAALVEKYCSQPLADALRNHFDVITITGNEDIDIVGCDYIILSLGYIDSEEGEALDRPFSLPDEDLQLIEKIKDLPAKKIGLIFSGGGVDLNSVEGCFDAIVHCWYPGVDGSRAIVDILRGEKNPSGKLPFCWDRVLDTPQYDQYFKTTSMLQSTNGEYSTNCQPHKNYPLDYSEGEHFGYRYYDSTKREPLYDFGFGLSYSTFEIAAEPLEKCEYSIDEIVSIRIKLTNISEIKGKEVVDIYTKSMCNRERDFKELRTFVKVEVDGNSFKEFELKVDLKDLKYCKNGVWIYDKGEYQLNISNKIYKRFQIK